MPVHIEFIVTLGEVDKCCFERFVPHICREHRSDHRQRRPRGRISRHGLQVRIGNVVGCRNKKGRVTGQMNINGTGGAAPVDWLPLVRTSTCVLN